MTPTAPPKDSERVDRAVALAKKAHDGQFRRTGEPYIVHPLAVKKILEDAKAALGKDVNDIFRFGSDNIELTALKMCDDGSGDVVLRINETKGLDGVHSFIMSDIFDMGFRFDIDAYETKTFRVNPEGMVRETNFAEGIIPFEHFEW